ncbi:hypothetical protein H1V43_15555 [Streptomyces sp. PSKA54]|uniref:Uncharacterized protein n=1 Tax=Streptomyces himalayensis subsp. aureolus TaxID=2758039 RepID=A0A7W2HGD1_9ACTN|nr:hypothetical protein [Streptomyces himalayensis]MBA4862786.1 hypothetical protein [Streptomyces himalayensis subsp. aureolus]
MGTQGLEIQEAEAFHHKEEVFERFGWAGMTALIAAGLLGLLGGRGPLTSAVATTPSHAVTVKYHRFERHTARTDLTIIAGAPAVREGQVVLTLSPEWVDSTDIQQVTPQPDVWQRGTEGLRLAFTAGPAPVTVEISYRPDGIGPKSGTVTENNTGARISFGQFVYP